MIRRGKGLTLAELVASVAITSVIGLAISGIAVALANANEHSERYYEYLQTGRVANAKLESVLRQSLLVVAASDDEITLWAEDDKDPGEINVSELVVVYRDPDTNRLIRRGLEFPASMTAAQEAALDTKLPLATASASTNSRSSIAYPQYETDALLANNVRSFAVYRDADPPMSRLVKFRMVIGDDKDLLTVVGAGRLRSDLVDKLIVTPGGTFRLEKENRNGN